MVGVTTIKEIPKVWDDITLAAATKNKLKTKQKKQNTNFGTDCLRNIVFAKVTATDMTVITNLSFYDRKDFLWTALLIYFPPSVRYRSMTLSDTCTIRRSWTLHPVPGLPVVAWGERGNILLARSFHAAHYDRDSCEKSAWKYRGNIVRWTWILQRFNEERNPFLVCGKTWLIITFRCVYCKKKYKMSSFKSNENIHKKEDGSYYLVSAKKASSVTV